MPLAPLAYFDRGTHAEARVLRADLVRLARDWLWPSAAMLNGGKYAALLDPGRFPVAGIG